MQKFTPTAESLNRLNQIFSRMREKSFHNHYHLLFDLRSFINKETVNYLEIGVYAGGSSSLMMSHPKKTNVYAVDLGKPISPEVVKQNIDMFSSPENQFQFIIGDSHSPETISKVTNMVKDIDILFIDGDHSYQGVLDDFSNFEKMVLPGGYIVFDDYMDWQYSPEVKNAVDDLVKTTYFTDNYQVIGSLKYDALAQTNVICDSSNEFIVQKRTTPLKPITMVQKTIAPPKVHTPIVQSSGELIQDMAGFPIFILSKKLENLQNAPQTTESKDKIRQLQRALAVLNAAYN